MPLTLYRRHTRRCTIHQMPLPPRAKRLYVECECPIWICGRTDDGIYPRQSTGLTDWKAAEALRASLIAKGKDEMVHGPRLGDCIDTYLRSRADELAPKTAGQNKLLLGKLRKFCEQRGAFFIRELSVDLLERFKTDGLSGLASTSRATSVAKLRCFLRDAFRRGWIDEALGDRITGVRAVYEQKDPYTDEEVKAILTGALKLEGGTHGFAKEPATFRVLLELMLETGLRVGDAIRFDPAALRRGDLLWIYTFFAQKRRRTQALKPLQAYLSERMKKSIDECNWLSDARPFLYGDFDNESYLANEVYERMRTIGRRAGVDDCRPHRLRDTFAVRKLLAGFSLDDVSRLLGHSSVKVTELYYAKWVTPRRSRLELLLAESLMNADGNPLGDKKSDARPLSAGGVA